MRIKIFGDNIIAFRLSSSHRSLLDALAKKSGISLAELIKMVVYSLVDPDRVSFEMSSKIFDALSLIENSIKLFTHTFQKTLAPVRSFHRELCVINHLATVFRGISDYNDEKQFTIFENPQSDGSYRYTLVCPCSDVATSLSCSSRLDYITCTACSQAYEIARQAFD
jgi:hypothetical protein